VGDEHFIRPAIITKGVQDRIQAQGQGLLRAPIDAEKIVVLAFEPNTLVVYRPHGFGVIFLTAVQTILAVFGTQPAGNALGIALDDIFADGIAKA